MTREITTFVYDDVEQRIVVEQRYSEAQDLLRHGLWNMVQAGAKFVEIQDLLRHNKVGGFDGWIHHKGLARRTVYRLISLNAAFGNCANLAQLDIDKSAAYLLAAPSTLEPARMEALSRADAGERITHATAKAIVKGHHSELVSRLEACVIRLVREAMPGRTHRQQAFTLRDLRRSQTGPYWQRLKKIIEEAGIEDARRGDILSALGHVQRQLEKADIARQSAGSDFVVTREPAARTDQQPEPPPIDHQAVGPDFLQPRRPASGDDADLPWATAEVIQQAIVAYVRQASIDGRPLGNHRRSDRNFARHTYADLAQRGQGSSFWPVLASYLGSYQVDVTTLMEVAQDLLDRMTAGNGNGRRLPGSEDTCTCAEAQRRCKCREARHPNLVAYEPQPDRLEIATPTAVDCAAGNGRTSKADRQAALDAVASAATDLLFAHMSGSSGLLAWRWLLYQLDATLHVDDVSRMDLQDVKRRLAGVLVQAFIAGRPDWNESPERAESIFLERCEDLGYEHETLPQYPMRVLEVAK